MTKPLLSFTLLLLFISTTLCGQTIRFIPLNTADEFSIYELHTTVSNKTYVLRQNTLGHTEIVFLREDGTIASRSGIILEPDHELIDYVILEGHVNFKILALSVKGNWSFISLGSYDSHGKLDSLYRNLDSSRNDLRRTGGLYNLSLSPNGKFASWFKSIPGIEKGKLLWTYKIIDHQGRLLTSHASFMDYTSETQTYSQPFLSNKGLHVMTYDNAANYRLGSTLMLYTGDFTGKVTKQEVYFKQSKPIEFLFLPDRHSDAFTLVARYMDFYTREMAGLLTVRFSGAEVSHFHYPFSKAFKQQFMKGLTKRQGKALIKLSYINNAQVDSQGNLQVVMAASTVPRLRITLNSRLNTDRLMYEAYMDFNDNRYGYANTASEVNRNTFDGLRMPSAFDEKEYKGKDRLRNTMGARAPATFLQKQFLLTFNEKMELIKNNNLSSKIKAGQVIGPEYNFFGQQAFYYFYLDPNEKTKNLLNISVVDRRNPSPQLLNLTLEKAIFYQNNILQLDEKKFLSLYRDNTHVGLAVIQL